MRIYYPDREKEAKKRRRERLMILLCFLFIACFTYLETRFLRFGTDLPVGGNILIFALINVNVILLILLLYLVLRNVVKLFLERRTKPKRKLKIRLVTAFVILTLVPTIVLFMVATQFISTSMDYWFSIQLEKSLKKALEVGQGFYAKTTRRADFFGRQMAKDIGLHEYIRLHKTSSLRNYIKRKSLVLGLDKIEVYDTRLRRLAKTSKKGAIRLPGTDTALLQQALKETSTATAIKPSPLGDLVIAAVGIQPMKGGGRPMGVVVTGIMVSKGLVEDMAQISKGYEDYQQLVLLKNPMKASHFIIFSMVTLLILFSATWVSFNLAKGITVPIQELVEATERIAEGDLDIHLDVETEDEIGSLVESFNRMAQDIRTSEKRLTDTNIELQASNEEIEKRRRYMETVLSNVAAGVVAVDARGIVTTINKYAETLLQMRAEDVLGKPYHELLGPEHLEVIEGFLKAYKRGRPETLRRQIRLPLADSLLTLMVSANVLTDVGGERLGVVVVFEDLTQFEKAQRMAAWREVARRIAHEVKNPLTPIQLSAQRLRRRYMERFDEDGQVFDECTSTIIKQVEDLKLLVNEFSNFARLPATNPLPGDIVEIAQEAVKLYRDSQPDINFEMEVLGEIPKLYLDKDQIKRVFINLMDNAIDALQGGNGTVVISISYDKYFDIVRAEVTDDGLGLSPEAKSRIFEPYFSTKEHGTGLGMAIVSSIIADHDGFVRIRDNHPRGTKVVLELPNTLARH